VLASVTESTRTWPIDGDSYDPPMGAPFFAPPLGRRDMDRDPSAQPSFIFYFFFCFVIISKGFFLGFLQIL
jgi:hypothetical protein